MGTIERVRNALRNGMVIPACPLALTVARKLDERRQRALVRYYRAAGATGIAVGVHTTQFAIHDPSVGLLEPVWTIAAEEWSRTDPALVKIAGICGFTKQAVSEATSAVHLGYDAGLLSLGALRDVDEDGLIAHSRAVSEVIPLIGFYLQPAAGGRMLSYSFWRRFAEIEKVLAIKIAPFNRYQTLDVIRAIAESGREEIALYTGNDDNIVMDLLTPFRFRAGNGCVERRIVGGLLGHWSFWTSKAVELHKQCRELVRNGQPVPQENLRSAVEITDANSAIFDAANHFAGCIPGIHEILRRQGLLEGVWCLNPQEALSPGQMEQIDRVYRAYPHLRDDEFVERGRDTWLQA